MVEALLEKQEEEEQASKFNPMGGGAFKGGGKGGSKGGAKKGKKGIGFAEASDSDSADSDSDVSADSAPAGEDALNLDGM